MCDSRELCCMNMGVLEHGGTCLLAIASGGWRREYLGLERVLEEGGGRQHTLRERG